MREKWKEKESTRKSEREMEGERRNEFDAKHENDRLTFFSFSKALTLSKRRTEALSLKVHFQEREREGKERRLEQGKNFYRTDQPSHWNGLLLEIVRRLSFLRLTI